MNSLASQTTQFATGEHSPRNGYGAWKGSRIGRSTQKLPTFMFT